MEPGLASGLALTVENDLYFVGKTYSGGVTPSGVHSNKVFKFTESWSELSTSPEIFSPRTGHCGFAANNTLFIFGGQCESTGEVFNSSYKLDLNTQEWTILSNLPQPRHSGTCCAIGDSGLIFGGANQEGVLDSLLVFEAGKK